MRKINLAVAVAALGLLAACDDGPSTPPSGGGTNAPVTVDCEPVIDVQTNTVLGYEVVTRDANTGAELGRRALGVDEECP